jgi:hypothetical protein
MGNNGASYTIYELVGTEADCARAYKELQQLETLKDKDGALVGLYGLNAFLYPEHISLEDFKTGSVHAPLTCDNYIDDCSSGDGSVVIHVQDYGSADPDIVYYYAKSRNLSMNYVSSSWDGDCYMIYDPDKVLTEFEVNIYDGVEERDCSLHDLFENEQSHDHISKIYDGKFLAWCNKNGHVPNKDNIRQLSIEFTESELAPDDTLWITPYAWDDFVEYLPETPPKFED